MRGLLTGLKHLALIALIMRAMLPVGWMPGTTPDAPIVICSLDAPVQHQDGKAPVPDAHHDECPFGATAHAAAPPDMPALALPAFHGFTAASDRAYAVAIAAHFSPQSPRAPPLNA